MGTVMVSGAVKSSTDGFVWADSEQDVPQAVDTPQVVDMSLAADTDCNSRRAFSPSDENAFQWSQFYHGLARMVIEFFGRLELSRTAPRGRGFLKRRHGLTRDVQGSRYFTNNIDFTSSSDFSSTNDSTDISESRRLVLVGQESSSDVPYLVARLLESSEHWRHIRAQLEGVSVLDLQRGLLEWAERCKFISVPKTEVAIEEMDGNVIAPGPGPRTITSQERDDFSAASPSVSESSSSLKLPSPLKLSNRRGRNKRFSGDEELAIDKVLDQAEADALSGKRGEVSIRKTLLLKRLVDRHGYSSVKSKVHKQRRLKTLTLGRSSAIRQPLRVTFSEDELDELNKVIQRVGLDALTPSRIKVECEDLLRHHLLISVYQRVRRMKLKRRDDRLAGRAEKPNGKMQVNGGTQEELVGSDSASGKTIDSVACARVEPDSNPSLRIRIRVGPRTRELMKAESVEEAGVDDETVLLSMSSASEAMIRDSISQRPVFVVDQTLVPSRTPMVHKGDRKRRRKLLRPRAQQAPRYTREEIDELESIVQRVGLDAVTNSRINQECKSLLQRHSLESIRHRVRRLKAKRTTKEVELGRQVDLGSQVDPTL